MGPARRHAGRDRAGAAVSGTILLDDVVTYLEMFERPARPSRPAPLKKLALMRAEDCTLSYYRYLYGTVGEPWVWFERRVWSDERLAAVLRRPETELAILYVAGVPAGYYELDRSDPDNVELAYFGLVPDFIGRGLGPWLLDAAIDAAFRTEPKRLFVHTCTFDHPRALGLYQRAGFRVYERRAVTFADPRQAGLLPRTLRHPRLPVLQET
jgi:ribosomal protein S18 acetylase RimI-like enzyme